MHAIVLNTQYFKRSHKWVIACRRKELLTKTVKELYTSANICERHFEASCFSPTKSKGQAKSLIAHSVPTIIDDRRPLSASCVALSKLQPSLFSPEQSQYPFPSTFNMTDAPSTSKKKKNSLQNAASLDGPSPETFGIGGGTNIPFAAAECPMDNVTDSEECSEQVLNMQIPFKDTEVMVLVMEYLHLYRTFKNLKDLARINVDLLYLAVDVSRVAEGKMEVDRVKDLIHLLMNGRDPYRVQLSHSKETVTANANCSDMDSGQQQNVFQTESVNSNTSSLKGRNEVDASHSVILEGEYGPEEAAGHAELHKNGQELPGGVNTQEVVAMPRTKPDQQIVNKSLETEWETSDFEKEASGSNIDISLIESPGDGDASAGEESHLNSKKTLETRFELEKYMESSESYDSQGSRFCKFCNRRFPGTFSLGHHLVLHLKNRHRICGHCGKSYKNRSCWERHVMSHQTPSCCLAEQEGNVASTSTTTTTTSIGRREPDRQVSYLTVSSVSGKNGNLAMAGDADLFLDPTLGLFGVKHKFPKVLKDRLELDRYLENPESHDGFGCRVCTFCGDRFEGGYYLSVHLAKKHLENKRFICKHCGKTCKQESSLAMHLVCHQRNGNKSIDRQPRRELMLCSVCGIWFDSESSFNSHVKNHKDNQSMRIETVSCDACGKEFRNTTTLRKHERKVHKERIEECPVCKKVVKKGCLPIHLKTHDRARPFKCSLCDKTFSHHSHRSAHQKRHKDVHLYRCSFAYCNLGFNSQNAVRIHEHVHAREKLTRPRSASGKVSGSKTKTETAQKYTRQIFLNKKSLS